MSKLSIQSRLREAMRKGNLTATDLAQWLDATRPTLNAWLRGVVPLENKREFLLDRIGVLEHTIRGKKRLPMPLYVKRHQRKAYIEELKENAHHAIPPKNPPARRRKTVVGEERV